MRSLSRKILTKLSQSRSLTLGWPKKQRRTRRRRRRMALHIPNSRFVTTCSSPAPAQYVSSVTTPILTPISRLHLKQLPIASYYSACVRASSSIPFNQKRASSVIVKAAASSDIDGPVPAAAASQPPPASSEDVENLPLESKLQLKLDQKLRMKLAKKIRLRRKRLVRKRQMRKKGRWPPSKVKKNKNV